MEMPLAGRRTAAGFQGRRSVLLPQGYEICGRFGRVPIDWNVVQDAPDAAQLVEPTKEGRAAAPGRSTPS
jgi:hypothetical protein